MAQVDIYINVEAEARVGVPLAQGIVDMVKAQLDREGHTLRVNKIKFLCDRCGQPMVLRQKTLVCAGCLADEASERQLDELLMGSPAPVMDALEAAVL